MILPYAPRQGREVEVSMSVSSQTLDIHSAIVVVDDGNGSRPDAVPCHAQKTHQAIESPYTECDVDPELIAPLMCEVVVDVQVTPDQRQQCDGKV